MAHVRARSWLQRPWVPLSAEGARGRRRHEAPFPHCIPFGGARSRIGDSFRLMIASHVSQGWYISARRMTETALSVAYRNSASPRHSHMAAQIVIIIYHRPPPIARGIFHNVGVAIELRAECRRYVTAGCSLIQEKWRQ